MRNVGGAFLGLAFVAVAGAVAFQAGRSRPEPGRASVPLVSANPQEPSVQEPPVDARPRWKPLWSVRIALPREVRISVDGRRVVVRDRRNRFTAIDGIDGRVAWVTPPLLRVRDMIVLDNGAVCCWAPLDPQADGLVLLDPATGSPRTLRVDGPVWSVAAAPGGRQIWVGCGDRSLRRYDVAGAPGPIVRLPGIPDSLAVTQRAVYAGMWLDSGLAAVSTDGKAMWTLSRSDPARRWTPFATADGRFAWVLGARGPGRTDKRIERFDPVTGATLWEKALDGGDLRWAVAQSVGWVAVSEREPGGQSKLHVMDAEGAWRVRGKGSRFFEPSVMAISPKGDRVTLLDGERGMVALDDRGRTISRRITLPKDPAAQVPPKPSMWIQTPDGTRLLVVGDNGVATLYASLP